MKKALKSLSFTLVFCMLLFSTLTAKADSVITVEGVSQNSISIKWTAKSDVAVTHYYVGIATNESDATANCTNAIAPETTSYTFNDLQAGTAYSIVLKYATKSSSAAEETLTKHASAVVYTLPGKPANVRLTSWSTASNKATIEWTGTGNAIGYQVQYEDADGDSSSVIVNDTKINISTENTSYLKNVKVRAYITVNDNKKYSDWSDSVFCFAQPTIREAEDGYEVYVKNGKLYVQWEKLDAPVTGYEVYVSTKRNGTYTKVKTISGKGKTTASINKYKGKKFNAKKPYYVYVVAYKKTSAKTYRSSANYTVFYNKGETYLTFRKQK
jgi:hypothetical protein